MTHKRVMPEGGEVRVVTDFLRLVLNRKYVYRIFDFITNWYKEGYFFVYDVNCKGKNIIISIIDSTGNKFYLRSHLGMVGEWYKTTNCSKDQHLKALLQCEDYLVCFTCYRFPRLDLYDEKALLKKLNSLGPDVLQTALYLSGEISTLFHTELFSLDYFSSLVTRKSLCKKNIGSLLLEQERFCGVGNYMRAEILYICRISPFRLLSSISKEETELLYTCIVDYSLKCYRAQGHSIFTFKVPEEIRSKRKIEIPLQVYNLDIDAFGNSVSKEKNGGRTIYWVPALQK